MKKIKIVRKFLFFFFISHFKLKMSAIRLNFQNVTSLILKQIDISFDIIITI